MRGRVALGASHVAVLAVLVAVALVVTSWWVVRGDAGTAEVVVPVAAGTSVSVEPSAATPEQEGAAPAGGGSVTEATVAEGELPDEVVVDVAGRVRRPGVLHLPAGSRVVDAIEEAGGARPRVDLSSLNLARVLVDGEQVLVGEPAGAAAPTPSGAAPAPGAPPALVDLNLADQALLETLPGVGPVTATSILTWREQNGAFTSVHELLEVDGIGDVTLARLEPLVTV
ncbi:MAG: DNA-binding protein [Nocardioides sp.]|nr:DNA-binding protein [Nocardioides sp.]